MSKNADGEDSVLSSKIVDLVHELDSIAVQERLINSDAATNCANAAAALRQWLATEGLGAHIDPLE
jgi:hypothetical protein